MHDLAEAIEKLKPLKEFKESLLECCKAEAAKKGLDCVDTQELGEVVDMIKDLAEAEKSCMEALYYQKVTEAMLSYEEPRYGYNQNRSATTGQYMSRGSSSMGGRDGNSGGGRMGFRPHEPMMDMAGTSWDGDDYMQSAMDPGNMSSRYGRAYADYKSARRHYTETKSPEDKREMSMHAEEHLRDTVSTVRDIWEDADPNLKRKMKEDFTKLMAEMNM